MRKIQLIIIGLSLCATMRLQAQFFSPESLGGAAFGGLAGALIAGPRDAGANAAIAAGAGFLLGALAREQPRSSYYSGYYAPGYYSNGPYRSYYSYGPYLPSPAVTYVNDPKPVSSNPTTVAQASVQPAPLTQNHSTYTTQPSSPMSSANALFGR